MTGSGGVLMLGPDAIAQVLPPAAAAEAIATALRNGLDPAADPPRTVTTLERGQLLLMPSQSRRSVGLKTVTVAPDNPAAGRPRIQGVYLHFDAATLQLVAILDAVALTNLRTPAVSMAAVSAALRRLGPAPDVLVYGAGPQALGHVRALSSALPDLGSVTHVVRRPHAVADVTSMVLAHDDPGVRDRLRQAAVVVCATTAAVPLFDARDVREDAVVIAVGSHESTARELPGELMRQATVVVEDVPTALREAGDVVLAIDEGALAAADLVPMAEAVRDPALITPGRRTIFKGTGMAWEDRTVAEAIVDRYSGVSHTPQQSH